MQLTICKQLVMCSNDYPQLVYEEVICISKGNRIMLQAVWQTIICWICVCLDLKKCMWENSEERGEYLEDCSTSQSGRHFRSSSTPASLLLRWGRRLLKTLGMYIDTNRYTRVYTRLWYRVIFDIIIFLEHLQISNHCTNLCVCKKNQTQNCIEYISTHTLMKVHGIQILLP